jgi:hypothetical protein
MLGLAKCRANDGNMRDRPGNPLKLPRYTSKT